MKLNDREYHSLLHQIYTRLAENIEDMGDMGVCEDTAKEIVQDWIKDCTPPVFEGFNVFFFDEVTDHVKYISKGMPVKFVMQYKKNLSFTIFMLEDQTFYTAKGVSGFYSKTLEEVIEFLETQPLQKIM